MISSKTDAVGRQLQQLWTSGTLTGLSDAQLLGRFTEARVRDATAESAFRELVNRHGPMVMGVCRQILRRPHDAEDAFQATFLVLVRKARSIRVHDSLAPWLYGVAYRTAHRARTIASRYRPADVEAMQAPTGPSSDDAYDFDLRPLLHEELGRLPAKYRDPIVLCHLEGKSHEEAARLLHWPVGTVSGRVSRGRQILKARLERRGAVVSPMILAANWLAGTPTIVPTALIESAVNVAFRLGAATAVSTSVLSLTQGVLRTMLLNKLKSISFAVLIAGGVSAGGVGVWAYQASRPSSSPAQAGKLAPVKVLVPEPDASTKRPGRGGRMGRLNKAQNSAGSGDLYFIKSSSIILALSADKTAWEAMSLEAEHATWQRLSLPAGISAVPLLGTDVGALMLKGKSIDHVAAFSMYTGTWSKQPLLKPVEEKIDPMIVPGCALYQSGNDFYAFSGRTGKWGVLHLEGDTKAVSLLSANDISVVQGNKLYVFSLKHGEWSQGVAIYRRPSQPDSPEAAPAK